MSFDECANASVSELVGIDQSDEDDGDWECGESTELLPNSPEDHGNTSHNKPQLSLLPIQ